MWNCWHFRFELDQFDNFHYQVGLADNASHARVKNMLQQALVNVSYRVR